MSENILKNLLFLPNPGIANLAIHFQGLGMKFLSVFFLLGIILEFFTSWDFKSVLARTFAAALIISVFPAFITRGVETSFIISNTLIKRFSPNNPLVNGFKNSYQTVKKLKDIKKAAASFKLWKALGIFAKTITTDTLATIAWLFIFLCFLLLKQLYSITYNLLFVFVGLSALLSILNISKNSLRGSIITLFWLYLTPLVVAVLLIIMGQSGEFTLNSDGSLANHFHGLLQLLVTAIFILLSPLFATALIAGTGLSSVGDSISKMGAMSAFLGAQKLLTLKGKQWGLTGGKLALKTGSAPIRFGASSLKEQMAKGVAPMAHQIRKDKGLIPTVGEYQEEHNLDRPGGERGMVKSKTDAVKSKADRWGRYFKNTNPLEKTIVGADNLLNRKENKKARIMRTLDSFGYMPERENLIKPLPLSNYFNTPEEKRIGRLHMRSKAVKAKGDKGFNNVSWDTLKVAKARQYIDRENQGKSTKWTKPEIKNIAGHISNSTKLYNRPHKLKFKKKDDK